MKIRRRQLKTVPARPAKLAFSAEEAAAAMGIGRTSFYQLLASSDCDLPRVRIGSRIVYPIDELRDWLKRQSVRRP